MTHACGPDCTSVAHEPILIPTGYDGFGAATYNWQTEEP